MLPCPDIFAVSDNVLLHMRFHLSKRGIAVLRNGHTRYYARHLRIKHSVQFIFAGVGRYNAQKNWAALSCRPLRGANLMCSSTLSVNCEKVERATQRYPDCRSPISQRSHVVNLRQTLQGKRGDLQEGGKPQVVYPLVRPRGVSALPAAGRGKSPLNFSEKLTNPEYSSSRSAFCGSSLCGRENIPPSAR